MVATTVPRFAQVIRSEGKSQITPASSVIDAVLLVASTAQSYTLPTGTDPAGGGTETLNPPPGTSKTATILRIANAMATAGAVYVAFSGTAAVPAASTATGLAPFVVLAGERILVQVPGGTTSISLITAGAGVVIIESWW